MLKFNTFDELPGEPEEYRKRTTIQAVQMELPFQVVTLEGEVEGKAGDWLAQGVGGELYPIANQIFLDSYSPVDEEESNNCAVCGKPTPSQNSRHEGELGVYFPDLDFITITEEDASSCHTCYTEVKEEKNRRDAVSQEGEVCSQAPPLKFDDEGGTFNYPTREEMDSILIGVGGTDQINLLPVDDEEEEK